MASDGFSAKRTMNMYEHMLDVMIIFFTYIYVYVYVCKSYSYTILFHL
jgi:hypothetical protein